MTKLFSLLIFLTLVVAAFMSLKPAGQNAARQVQGLPWQIEVLPQGRSRVFGITLGKDTLGQARERLGPDMELAIIGNDDSDSALEMYYDRYTAGVLSGKLILSAELPAEQLAQMIQRSPKKDYLKTGARKVRLHPDDLPAAWRAPLRAITFIPTVNLDRETAIRRFGQPAESIATDPQTTHLLYPEQGLDLILNEDGREALQYVAPKDFARLREPLVAAQDSVAGQ